MAYRLRRTEMKIRHFGKNRQRFFLTAACIVIFCTSPAFAHKVTVFAWVEGDQVFTESKLGGGKRVAAGKITVYDATDNILLTGNTNDQGEFSFTLPQKPPLIIELNAGMGHQARWALGPDDVDEEIFPSLDEPEKGVVPPEPAPESLPVAVSDKIDAAALETIIEKVLDRKLKPVIRLLADTRQKDPSLTEIIGGIGYIMGIVGIIAYFKSRSSGKAKQ